MGRDKGEGKGERLSGTTIKDTWTKPRGGVRGSGGGKMQTTGLEQ